MARTLTDFLLLCLTRHLTNAAPGDMVGNKPGCTLCSANLHTQCSAWLLFLPSTSPPQPPSLSPHLPLPSSPFFFFPQCSFSPFFLLHFLPSIYSIPLPSIPEREDPCFLLYLNVTTLTMSLYPPLTGQPHRKLRLRKMKSLAWPHNLEFLDIGQDLFPHTHTHKRHQDHTTASPHTLGRLMSYSYRGTPVLSAPATRPLVPTSLTFTPPPSLSLLLPGWRDTVAAKLPNPRQFCPGTCASSHFFSKQPFQSYLKHRETLFTCGDTLKEMQEGREGGVTGWKRGRESRKGG